MFELSGKVAVVTGAQRGIGKGIALALARQGASVVVSDLDKGGCEAVCAEIRAAGGKALAVACDVSNKEAVDALVQAAVKAFGSLDVMVNNAGVLTAGPVADLPEADVDRVLAVNLKGVIFGTQAAAKQMQKQGRGGKIINLTSIAALHGYPQLAHYCASKGGVSAFTRAAAVELAPLKINVNAIAPGAIETPMLAAFLPDDAARQEMANGIPWKRIGTPADIAAAAVFLASPEADFATGHVLVVDGGDTAGEPL